MKKFREYISEEVVPSALVANGTIDIDNEDVRASINLALAKVTSDGAITPYIALNRISKALSYFHIILPKRIYLEGAKGVEVHEIRQFGHKMGMTDQGEFVHEVPGKYYLFLQYGMNNAMPYGGQLAYPNMGGTFRVMAKVVDKIELDRLVSMAELALAEECDAEMQQKKAKMLAPHETMHDVTSDEKKKGNKAAVETSEKKKVNEGWVALGPRGASSVYDKFGDVRPGTKWYGRRPPKANKPGDAEPGAGDTYKGSKQGGKTRFAKSVKEDKDPCWKGYEMVGMKKKRGRNVPNCVPVKEGIADTLRSMNPFAKAADALGTSGAKAAPDTRIMGNPDTQKKKPPKEGSPQSSFPSVNEGRMPASVIKHKQKLANMTPEEKAKKFAGKSEEELKSMARRHGYGKDSTEYSKHVKEEQVEEAKKEKPHWEKYPIYTATGRYKPPQEVIDKYHPEHSKKKTTKTVKKDVKEETINEISHKLALKAMKKSEKRADDEYEADQASDRLSDYKTHEDRAKRLRGHMRKKFGNDKPGRGNTGKYTDRLGDQGGDGRLGVYSVNTHGKRAGLPPKEQVNRLKGNIKFSLGKHHKPNLPEETQIDEISRYKARLYVDKAQFDKKDRSKGISLARKKLMLGSKAKVPANEETQLDEISKGLVKRYKKAAESDRKNALSSAETSRWHKKNRALPLKNRIAHGNEEKWLKGIAKKREKGIAMADKRLDEKAPPGAKFERMVKHIKAGYAKDGLTKKEKGIAYATAWKAKKRESED